MPDISSRSGPSLPASSIRCRWSWPACSSSAPPGGVFGNRPMSSVDGDGPLLAQLRARIEREGPLRIDDYMRSCLADPEHGYWRRQATIGAAGDFVTAPEISQVFGELIGLWAGVVWRNMGAPAPVNLVELGPGRGTLLRDALRAARSIPHFLAAASVHLIERSAPLREAQRGTLACPADRRRHKPESAVTWAGTWAG